MDPTFNRSSRHPFVLEKIDTDKQKADLFTKGFAADKFQTLRKLLCGWWDSYKHLTTLRLLDEREKKDSSSLISVTLREI